MAKEKRLIDAYKLEDMVRRNRASYHNKDDVIAAIAGQPTVDAVEVVRCKNCTESDPCDVSRNRVWCRRMGRYMKEDGYCSEGKADEALQQLP